MKKNLNSPYKKIIKVLDNKFFSFFIYHMVPNGVEESHYHDGIEIEYVLKGNSSTHKKGRFYIRKPAEVHHGKNDSNKILIFACITIPAENENNTHYVK